MLTKWGRNKERNEDKKKVAIFKKSDRF